MEYFDDLLNKIKFNSTRKQEVSKVKNVLSENVKRFNAKCENITERFDGHGNNKDGIKKQTKLLAKEIALVKRKQVELTEMDKDVHDKMVKLEEAQAGTEREAVRLQGRAAKMQTSRENLDKKAEAALHHLRCKVRLYRDLTGIYWDYDATMGNNSLQGYVQNKNACRVKAFSLHSDSALHPIESSTLLWRTLGEVTK